MSTAIDNRATILEQLATGKYMKDIAADLGVSKSALSHVLASDPEYQKAREDGMAERLDEAHRLMAEITDNRGIDKEDAQAYLNLARIREIGIKRLEWRAEREFPNRFGAAKINLNIINSVSMSDVLSSTAGELLEHIADTE